MRFVFVHYSVKTSVKAAARAPSGRQPLMPGLAERAFLAFTAAAGGGAAFARAVQRGDGLDVRPHEVVADEGAGHVAALAGGLGDEADARAGNLVGIHFLLGVHALTVGNASVVERAEAVHTDGAPGVHERAYHHAQGFDGGFRIGSAHGGHHGNLLAKLVHFHGRAYCHCLRVPFARQGFVNSFEYRHTQKNLS